MDKRGTEAHGERERERERDRQRQRQRQRERERLYSELEEGKKRGGKSKVGRDRSGFVYWNYDFLSQV